MALKELALTTRKQVTEAAERLRDHAVQYDNDATGSQVGITADDARGLASNAG